MVFSSPQSLWLFFVNDQDVLQVHSRLLPINTCSNFCKLKFLRVYCNVIGNYGLKHSFTYYRVHFIFYVIVPLNIYLGFFVMRKMTRLTWVYLISDLLYLNHPPTKMSSLFSESFLSNESVANSLNSSS